MSNWIALGLFRGSSFPSSHMFKDCYKLFQVWGVTARPNKFIICKKEMLKKQLNVSNINLYSDNCIAKKLIDLVVFFPVVPTCPLCRLFWKSWGTWTDFLKGMGETKFFYAVRSIGKGFCSLTSDLPSDLWLGFDFGTFKKFYVSLSNCYSQNTCIAILSFSLFLSECFPYLSEPMLLQYCQLVLLLLP